MTSEILTALTALCAVLLGPLVSLHVVRREFAAQVLSGNRQDWINTLRERLAALIGFVAHYAATKAAGQLDDVKALALQERAYGLWAQITLMINPAERDHVELVNRAETTLHHLFSSPQGIDANEVKKLLDGVTRQSQTILKREWERVKKGQ
jgi:hypothetical protein